MKTSDEKPTKEDIEEFLRIPKTPLGKLEAMNKCFLGQKSNEDALNQMMAFMHDLVRNNPDYLEAIKDCQTEEEIKQKIGEFFAKNPKMVEEVQLSLLAARRNKEFK